MNVSELIKELKKMPKTAEVYCADHDHSEYETNGSLFSVVLTEKEYANEYDEKENPGFDEMPDKWIRLGL
ncbi:MAG: hypothetical protein ACUZ8E_04375 [Candidatus Anammoxibacter sp.]